MNSRLALSTALSLVIYASALCSAQPSLLPPGAPTSSSGRMGVRTEIRSIPFTITTPGSYYLSGDLTQTVPGSSGITIAASRVTIDLMGFSLTGMGTPNSGITFQPSAVIRDVTIHHGFVSGWGGSGIDISLIPDGHVWEVTADGNGANGVWAGPVSNVRDIVATNNGDAGVRTDFGCRISGVVAYYNVADGIATGSDCHVSDATAVSNSMGGINLGASSVLVDSTADGNGGVGILASTSSRIADCSASFNGSFGWGDGFDVFGDANLLRGCTAYQNASNGFESSSGTSSGSSAEECVAAYNGYGAFGGSGFAGIKNVFNCRANNNTGDGIVAFVGAHVYRNTCESNILNGIEAGSNGCVIEQNYVLRNIGIGIKTFGSGGLGNLVTSNRATQNTGGNFSFTPSDTTGPIIAGPTILSSPAAAVANVSF